MKILNFNLSNPVKPEELEEAYKQGLIRKSDLKHGAYYLGTCRNANIAIWDAKKNVFYYLRSKFGAIFEESINHPEDDNSFDVFLPMEEIIIKYE